MHNYTCLDQLAHSPSCGVEHDGSGAVQPRGEQHAPLLSVMHVSHLNPLEETVRPVELVADPVHSQATYMGCQCV